MKNTNPHRTPVYIPKINYSQVVEIVFVGLNNYTNSLYIQTIRQLIGKKKKTRTEHVSINDEPYLYSEDAQEDKIYIDIAAFSDQESILHKRALTNMISGETLLTDIHANKV
jgi:hypothetical protein